MLSSLGFVYEHGADYLLPNHYAAYIKYLDSVHYMWPVCEIVGNLTNTYYLYFADERNDTIVVPYMDGDYFPAEVENVIKDIEEGKCNSPSDSEKKNEKNAR